MKNDVAAQLLKSGYLDSFEDGKVAVKNEYREKIRAKNPRNLKGSMDIDNACKNREPNSPRWDYLVVIWKNNLENLALIEIHGAAKSENVKEVIQKKEWLIKWLKNAGVDYFKKSFTWVATGSISIIPSSRYAKELSRRGIDGPRKVTKYLDTEVEYY